jgi:hypothetical protein
MKGSVILMDYEEMSREDLIMIIKTLTLIRSNYEKMFGVIMYANGETRKSTEALMESREAVRKAFEEEHKD